MFTGIHLTNWLQHRHLSADFTPLTIICGPNGSGKTSIADAMAFALLSDLRRVQAKGERPELISEGNDEGTVTLQIGDAAISRDVRTGKLSTQGALPFPKGAVSSAAPYLLDAATFGAATDDEKRRLLLEVARIDMSPPALLGILEQRGHPADMIAELKTADRSLDAWQKVAADGATAARGAWKAITGEAYGAKKAEGWRPANIQDAPTDEELATARDHLLEIETKLANLNRSIGAREHERAAAHRIQQENAAVLKQMEKASEAKEILETLDIESARQAHERAVAALAAARARRETHTFDCPHCGGSLALADGALHAYRPPAAPIEAGEFIELERAEAAARTKLTAMIQRQAQLQAILDQSQSLSDKLQVEPTVAAITEDETQLKEMREQKSAAEAEMARLQRARDAAAWGHEKIKNAAAEHEKVKAWGLLQEAVAPGGIPAEKLQEGLAQINKELAALSADAGWPTVAIRPDMVATFGGRRYNLLSESEQWRADAVITIMLAEMSDMRFAVLDRMDLLNVSARAPLLRWLYQLTQAHRVSSIIVLATLKEPPQVPADVYVKWLGAPVKELQAA